MKQLILILFSYLILNASFSQSNHENYITFKISDKTLIRKISQFISIDKIRNNQIWAYANDKELNDFIKFDIPFEKIAHPNQAFKGISMASTINEMVNWDKYPTYELYEQMLDNYATQYSSICQLVTIGKLPSGRKLLALKITDHANTIEDEPEFLFTSTIHGDEATGFMLTLRLIDYLLKNYGSDSRITNLVNNVAIYINPLANPDGTYAGGNSTISLARRYNANYIDLNRNFPDPRSGNHPDENIWQPETVAMMNFATEHHFTLSANYHGGAEVINYPWDTWQASYPDYKTHPDNNWFIEISSNYANTVHANSSGNYLRTLDGQSNPSGITNGGDWYVISGGRQDYMNWWHHTREVTMEISETKMPSSDLLPQYWNYNRDAMIGYIEECLYGIKGKVTDSKGNPLKATVKIENHDDEHSTVLTNITIGNYHRLINSGTYTVSFTVEGYAPKIFNNIVVETKKTTVLNVTFTPEVIFCIFDKKTSEPIYHATINFNNQTQKTDQNGQAFFPYTFENIPKSYTIQANCYKNLLASKIFLENEKINIYLEDSQTNCDDIYNSTIKLFPNPFFDKINFNFELYTGEYGRIDIFNPNGILLKTIFEGKFTAGQNCYLWDGTNQQGAKMSSGIYYYRITSEKHMTNGKIVLLK